MKADFVFEATGTHWEIDIKDPLTAREKNKLLLEITSIIGRFEKTYSRFRKDSLIRKISKTKGTYVFPDNAKDLLDLYKKTYEITEHLSKPFTGSAVSEAGYDSEYSFKTNDIHPVVSWEEVIDYNHPFLKVKKPAILDFGAAGKGYLIDIVSRFLRDKSISSYTIDAGGDILDKNNGEKSLMVGLEHPEFQDQIIGIAEINNQSICCSGGNRRKRNNFHHIINPQSLKASREVLSTWVISDNTITADALATCLFLVKPDKLQLYFDFSYALVYKDLSLICSNDFPGEFFLKEEE